MIAPETLLKMRPLDALRAQINEVLKKPLKASYLKISDPISIDEIRTMVTVQVDRSQTPVDYWGVEGIFEFEYDRIDMESFTDGISKVVSTLTPAEAWQLFATILDPYHIPVVPEDVAGMTALDLGTFDILAGTSSYRWTGGCQVTVAQRVFDITSLAAVRAFTPPFTSAYMSSDFKRLIGMYLSISNTLPFPIQASMFTVDPPRQIDLPDKGYNTAAVLKFTGFPYQGDVEVTYSRRAFTRTSRWPIMLQGGQLADTATLHSVLSERMGCVITQNDLMPNPVDPLTVGETRRLIVPFAESSLVYVGEIWIDYTRTQ